MSGHSSEATFRHQFRLQEHLSPTQFRRLAAHTASLE
jgi:transcriptional regulator GlxA family with amidase domain